MLAYTLLAGLLFGFYFTLIRIGLNLVFGVVRIGLPRRLLATRCSW